MKDLFKRLIIPFDEIDRLLSSEGLILDLGCGDGIVSDFLGSRVERSVIGVDQNKTRVCFARDRVKNNERIKIVESDILNYSPPKKIDGCFISDVLHHLSRSDQDKLLDNVSKFMKKGGVLVVKEINAEDMIRSKLSRLWDFIFYPQDKISYLSKHNLMRKLQKLGFEVYHKQTNKFAPASVHLYIARKL